MITDLVGHLSANNSTLLSNIVTKWKRSLCHDPTGDSFYVNLIKTLTTAP
jgi:hypothetical protein